MGEAHVVHTTNEGELQSWVAIDIPDVTLRAWAERLPVALAGDDLNTWVFYTVEGRKRPTSKRCFLSDKAFETWRNWLTDMMREEWPGPGRPKHYLGRAHSPASARTEREQRSTRVELPPKIKSGSAEDPEWQKVLTWLSEEQSKQN